MKYDRTRKSVQGDFTVYMGVSGGWIHVPTGWASDDAALDTWAALYARYPMATHTILYSRQSPLARSWEKHTQQLIRDSRTGRFDRHFLQIMQDYDRDFKREADRQKREDPFVAVSNHLLIRISQLDRAIRDGSLSASEARLARRALDEWNDQRPSQPPSGRRRKGKR